MNILKDFPKDPILTNDVGWGRSSFEFYLNMLYFKYINLNKLQKNRRFRSADVCSEVVATAK